MRTVEFQGVSRTVVEESTNQRGTRCFYLAGPRVKYYCTEREHELGSFMVLNSKWKVIGNLLEKECGEIVEAAYVSARHIDGKR